MDDDKKKSEGIEKWARKDGEYLQLINENGDFCEERIQSFLDKSGIESKDYFVLSVLGQQSSGKSTLLNLLFNTTFDVLDTRKGRGATTKGVYYAVSQACKLSDVEKKMILFDLEGSDAGDRKGKSFERKAGSFVLSISDVMIVNVGVQGVGLSSASGTELLRECFRTLLKLYQREVERRKIGRIREKTTLIYVIRDFDEKWENFDECVTSIRKTIHETWDILMKPLRESAKRGKAMMLRRKLKVLISNIRSFPKLDKNYHVLQTKVSFLTSTVLSELGGNEVSLVKIITFVEKLLGEMRTLVEKEEKQNYEILLKELKKYDNDVSDILKSLKRLQGFRFGDFSEFFDLKFHNLPNYLHWKRGVRDDDEFSKKLEKLKDDIFLEGNKVLETSRSGHKKVDRVKIKDLGELLLENWEFVTDDLDLNVDDEVVLISEIRCKVIFVELLNQMNKLINSWKKNGGVEKIDFKRKGREALEKFETEFVDRTRFHDTEVSKKEGMKLRTEIMKIMLALFDDQLDRFSNVQFGYFTKKFSSIMGSGKDSTSVGDFSKFINRHVGVLRDHGEKTMMRDPEDRNRKLGKWSTCLRQKCEGLRGKLNGYVTNAKMMLSCQNVNYMSRAWEVVKQNKKKIIGSLVAGGVFAGSIALFGFPVIL